MPSTVASGAISFENVADKSRAGAAARSVTASARFNIQPYPTLDADRFADHFPFDDELQRIRRSFERHAMRDVRFDAAAREPAEQDVGVAFCPRGIVPLQSADREADHRRVLDEQMVRLCEPDASARESDDQDAAERRD